MTDEKPIARSHGENRQEREGDGRGGGIEENHRHYSSGFGMSKSFRWSSIRSDDGFKARSLDDHPVARVYLTHGAKKDPLECDVQRGAAVNSRLPASLGAPLSPRPCASRQLRARHARYRPRSVHTWCAACIVVIIIKIFCTRHP